MAGHEHPGSRGGREEWNLGSREQEVPGREAFQLGAGSEAFSATVQKLCALALFHFPYCSQSWPKLKSVFDIGRGGVTWKPASSSLCWASLGRVFMLLSSNCFEWEDIHMVQNRSVCFIEQKSPSFSSTVPSFPPPTHCWSQLLVFVCIHLEFTYEYQSKYKYILHSCFSLLVNKRMLRIYIFCNLLGFPPSSLSRSWRLKNICALKAFSSIFIPSDIPSVA